MRYPRLDGQGPSVHDSVRDHVLLAHILPAKTHVSSYSKHCFERSALRSSLYVCVPFPRSDAYVATDTSNDSLWDFVLVATIYKTAAYVDTLITPEQLSLPSPYLYSAARFALWALYAFANGLVMTGLWVCAHECGHQAFSESKFVNNAVGWVLHSGYVFLIS